MRQRIGLFVILLGMVLMLGGCSGSDGSPGPQGAQGVQGESGRNSYLTSAELRIEIQSASIAADGMVTTIFKITDGQGKPLDLNGDYTEGAVNVSFIHSRLAEDASGSPLQYSAYALEDRYSPITGETATQPVLDSGGTFTEIGSGEGTYSYVFNTPAVPADSTLTHTIAAYATRPYEDKTYTANATYDFVPSGGAVAVTSRDVVTLTACNTCHGELRAHGGTYRDTKLCVTCHFDGVIDPDTGNSLDFRVMIHKIHRGGSLPSVAAGTPYQLIGDGQEVNDYSPVVYPHEIQRCTGCHAGTQGDYWMTRPGRAACGSCHDLISFTEPAPVGMALHTGGAQSDDANCGACHPQSGGAAGIADMHLTPATDPAAPALSLEIVSITNTAPAQSPTVIFDIAVDGVPRDILTNPLDRLTATIAGPTTDYSAYWQTRAQGAGATGTLVAIDALNGRFSYTFPPGDVIPPSAFGSYALALEGRIGTAPDQYYAVPPVAFFPVTDPTAVPRREVVSDAACKACHVNLSNHGGNRSNVRYCAFCHNPKKANSDYVARFEDSTVPARSMDLKVLIHKLHRSVDLSGPYIIWRFPAPNVGNPGGSLADYITRPYPADLRDCTMCHLPATYGLPLSAQVLPSTELEFTCTEDPAADGDDYCNAPFWTAAGTEILPTAAVCTSCHDGQSTVAHAETMTSDTGVESCETCHGVGSAYGIDMYHTVSP